MDPDFNNDSEIQNYLPKQKVDLINKMTDDLERIREDFSQLPVKNSQDIKIYWQALRSYHQAYQQQLTEVIIEIIEEFRDMPDFAAMFPKWINGKEKKIDKDLIELQLYDKLPQDFIDEKRRLFNLISKHIDISTFLDDIYWEALTKIMVIVSDWKDEPVMEKKIKTKKLGEWTGKLVAIDFFLKGISEEDIMNKYRITKQQLKDHKRHWEGRLTEKDLSPEESLEAGESNSVVDTEIPPLSPKGSIERPSEQSPKEKAPKLEVDR